MRIGVKGLGVGVWVGAGVWVGLGWGGWLHACVPRCLKICHLFSRKEK